MGVNQFGNNFKQFLISRIPKAYSASGGKMIQCRCRYCSDSGNIRSKGHMYISIPNKDDDIPWFYCHKCHIHGYVTNKTLLQWGIYDDQIGMQLLRHNKVAFSNPRNKQYLDRDVYYLNNNLISDNSISRSKLNYINQRLGTSLNYGDLLRSKIVLNLNDLLASNRISKYTRNESIIKQLDRYFIGFISMDNAFITMRRVVDEGVVYQTIDNRYVNYNIFDKQDNTERHYTIPVELNLAKPERIKLNIAEGAFDILSIRYNLRKDPNQIYSAIGGSEYLGLIGHFINVLKIPYLEVHVYPDNDNPGSRENMMYIKDFLKPYGIQLYIHRNLYLNEKDFGVPLERIDERIERLL